jgi:hypothetical protein
MNREDLQQAIITTLQEMEQLKQQLNQTTNPREELKLTRRKKELQLR